MTIPNRHSTLTQWIDWLLQLHAQEIDLGLDRVRQVAEIMALKHPAPVVISVAGTNGKGSSVAFLVAILKAAGYQVGAYTSPHIQLFNERIQINGTPVDDDLIVAAFTDIEAARGDIKLTYFEFATLAALSVFKSAGLDVAVLEVGLGGRLDAVNIVDADAALITAIDVDHVDWLGGDRSVIATEKAGIMRIGKIAVCSDEAPPTSLLAYAERHKVLLSQFKVDFDLQINDQAWSFIDLSAQDALSTPNKLELNNLPLPALKGAFQLNNAAGAIALLSKLTTVLPVDKRAISLGLQQATHPGRLQSLKIDSQNWLIDVAHNPQSALALADYLQQSKKDEPQEGAKPKSLGYLSLFSVLNDKDALPMVQQIAPFVSLWVVADLQVPRATSAQDLRVLLHKAGVADVNILVQESMTEAVVYAQQHSDMEVLVWGSFFTVSQVLSALQAEPADG